MYSMLSLRCSLVFAPQQWLFDSPTAAPRLLKQRSGHHAPPHLVRYYGDDGKAILTAGADHALRYTSIVRDSRGYELSQGEPAPSSRLLYARRKSDHTTVPQDLLRRRPTTSALSLRASSCLSSPLSRTRPRDPRTGTTSSPRRRASRSVEAGVSKAREWASGRCRLVDPPR